MRHNIVALTLYARQYKGDECGSYGLPLTPNSVKIVGRLRSLQQSVAAHAHLCQYLDIVRCKDEQLVLVSEANGQPLDECDLEGVRSDWLQIISDVCSALAELHSNGIVCRRLSRRSVLIMQQQQQQQQPPPRARLFNYGLFFITGCGEEVDFPVGDLECAAPETLLESPVLLPESPRLDCRGVDPRCDSFSLGLLALYLATGFCPMQHYSVQQWFSLLLTAYQAGENLLDRLTSSNAAAAEAVAAGSWPPGALSMTKACLHSRPELRPTVQSLIGHEALANCQPEMGLAPRLANQLPELSNIFSDRPVSLDYQPIATSNSQLAEPDADIAAAIADGDLLRLRPVQEVYHWWTLAGGDAVQCIRSAGLMQLRYRPILQLPSCLTADGSVLELQEQQRRVAHNVAVPLCQRELSDRIRRIDPLLFFPMPLLDQEADQQQQQHQQQQQRTRQLDFADVSTQPKAVKERDLEYQIERCVLFRHLLTAYPASRSAIVNEASKDVPPLYRAHAWAALLNVNSSSIRSQHASIDPVSNRESRSISDKQLNSDIPRCHQYNALMASPHGHVKLRRLIKAWVSRQPQCVYYQGVDSIAAVFLHLNFTDEALALACFEQFVLKYQAKFFVNENNKVTQEYFSTFQQLLAFHCPSLANYLSEIGLSPDHYAYPWFLTMFAHHFALPAIVHLWDAILLGNSSFPLFMGLAVLLQLMQGQQAAGRDFNEVVHDILPQVANIDIERCIADANAMYAGTPHSCSFRQHDGDLEHCGQLFPIEPSDPNGQQCRVPRISVEELLSIIGYVDAKSSTISSNSLCVLDIRSGDEYANGSVSNSIHLPQLADLAADAAAAADHNHHHAAGDTIDGGGGLGERPAVALPDSVQSLLQQQQHRVKVLLARSDTQAVCTANWLVADHAVTKLCVLQGGVQALRTAGCLTVSA